MQLVKLGMPIYWNARSLFLCSGVHESVAIKLRLSRKRETGMASGRPQSGPRPGRAGSSSPHSRRNVRHFGRSKVYGSTCSSCVLNEPKEGQKRAWFVIDELASLQKLPQLHTAIRKIGRVNNPVILGFPGKAQLEYRYGHLAEVMLSQPATSIWLKTKEPTAGEWVSKFIGRVEIERLRETHFDGSRAGRNFALDRQIDPLVMESEISGLPELHASLKYENFVTRFSFPYFDMPVVASDFDLRDTPRGQAPLRSEKDRNR
jgi:hypothetical protein